MRFCRQVIVERLKLMREIKNPPVRVWSMDFRGAVVGNDSLPLSFLTDTTNITRKIKSVKSLLKIISESRVLLPKDCPLIWYIGDWKGAMKLSKIERMRQAAAAGVLPTRAARIDAGRKKEGSEGSDTSGGLETQKRRWQRTDAGSRTDGERKKIGVVGQMDREEAERFCREEVEKSFYTYRNRSTGSEMTLQGNVSHGKKRNVMQEMKFKSRWEEYRPYLKDAVLWTFKPYSESKDGNHAEQMRELLRKWRTLSENLRKNYACVIWWGLEYSAGAQVHIHAVIATCEESDGWRQSVGEAVERSPLGEFAHSQDWSVSDAPAYCVKSLSHGVDEYHEIFEKGGDLQSWDYNALRTFMLAKETGLKYYAYPRTSPEKEERLPSYVREENKEEEEMSKQEKGALRGEFDVLGDVLKEDVDISTRERAAEIFGGSVCWVCHRNCKVVEWLEKCVKPSKVLPYMTLQAYMNRSI